MLVQYLTTCVTCLVLAFLRSWALTLVILSTVPLLMIVQGLSQGFANPLLAHERDQTGRAATIINRAVAAISTVKAFNATELEYSRASSVFGRLRRAARKLNALWATTSGVSQFVMMAMFVQGFFGLVPSLSARVVLAQAMLWPYFGHALPLQAASRCASRNSLF